MSGVVLGRVLVTDSSGKDVPLDVDPYAFILTEEYAFH